MISDQMPVAGARGSGLVMTHFEAQCCSAVGEREVPFSLVLLERRALHSVRRHSREGSSPGWGSSMVVCWAEGAVVAFLRWEQ